MKTDNLTYQDQDSDHTFKGYYAYQNDHQQKRPVILICHDWSGRNAFSEKKAMAIAELGYVGFAVDMYGEGKQGKTKEEKTALMQPLLQNRTLILSRLLAALKKIKSLDVVDSSKIGIIGFCFGGLCALDLARHSNEIKGTVSFHGNLKAGEQNKSAKITSKILVLHGYNDPMVPPQDVLTFAEEMTHAKADWQIHMYGNTSHAFTNPEAHDPNSGLVYQPLSDKRSWQSMQNFFVEIFGKV